MVELLTSVVGLVEGLTDDWMRGIRTNADRKSLILRIRQQRHIRLAAGDRSETSELRRQSQRTRSRRAVRHDDGRDEPTIGILVCGSRS